MNDDRLTHLLTEATDLHPSADLRTRVADLRPERRRTPWFALSGLTAALAVAALVVIPREASVAGALRRAAQNGRSVSAVLRCYAPIQGTWRLTGQTLVAPGWTRYDDPDGGFRLDAPEGGFQRQGAGGPVIKGQAAERSQNGPTLDEHLRALRTLGTPLTVSWGSYREEEGRPVRDILIDMAARRERETITVDVRTELPIRILSEARLSSGWIPQSRTELAYPGPQGGSHPFWAGIDRSRVVRAEEMVRPWEARLAPVLRNLELSGGAVLKVRDLRVLPSGDVLMLYTGPRRLRTRLVGEDGTAFVRVAFDPNEGRMIPRSRPPIVLQGEPLRGMWFTPHEEGPRTFGALRLEVRESRKRPDGEVGTGESGTFRLQPVREAASLPEWADAIDCQTLKGNFQAERIEARMVALYDRWVDSQGKSFKGVYALEPESGSWAADEPPAKGLRRDPKAAERAAAEFRTLMAHFEAEGTELNPVLVDTWLGRFEREARGE